MSTNEQCSNESGLSSFLQAIDAGDASPDVEGFNEEVFIKEMKNAWGNVSGDELVGDTAKLEALREALIEGEESGVVEDFDPETFIAKLNES